MGSLTYKSLNNAHQNHRSSLLTVGWHFTEGTYLNACFPASPSSWQTSVSGTAWPPLTHSPEGSHASDVALKPFWLPSSSQGSVGFELISDYVVFISVRIFFFLYAYFSGNLPICLEVILKINIIALIPSLKCFLKTSEWIILLSCCSCVRPCATPQTAAHQAPPSLGFSRQEHWSGLPFPSPVHETEKWKWSRSVVSYSLQSHGLQPTRLLCPWDFPGKSTGVGCHYLLRSAL